MGNERITVVITAADCVRETFRGSGPGGQNRNKRETGVRWRHRPSGATGECCEQRHQAQNSAVAWRRMAASRRFQAWAAAELGAREEGWRGAAAKVDAALAEEHLRVEVGAAACVPGEKHCDKP